MCGRFSMLTFDEVQGVVAALEARTPLNVLPDWPARPCARPGQAVGVIVPAAGGTLTSEALMWGFMVGWSARPVFNTRIETALGHNPGMWEHAIEQGRCVAVAARFFEPHATETVRSPRSGKQIKRQYGFALPDSRPLLLAAVQDEGRFSLVTTEPNQWVRPVHDRMPLVLQPAEARQWLFGGVRDLGAFADRSAIDLCVSPDDPAPADPSSADELRGAGRARSQRGNAPCSGQQSLF